jgi:replication fork protection complex subunit Tof1/Swi1
MRPLIEKVTALHLFQQILEKKAVLPKTDGARDLLQMITFVLRKFFKKVQEDPFLIVEALTPKTRGKWKAISSYQSDESDSDGGGGAGRVGNKKTPAELEFVKNKNLSWSQQMKVVIGVLLKDGKQSLIEWIVEVSATP